MYKKNINIYEKNDHAFIQLCLLGEYSLRS